MSGRTSSRGVGGWRAAWRQRHACASSPTHPCIVCKSRRPRSRPTMLGSPLPPPCFLFLFRNSTRTLSEGTCQTLLSYSLILCGC